jgi:hypothetical protein
VFLGDEPLKFGTVVFQPLQGGQPAQGKVAADGSFVLSTFNESDGASVGRHRVKVACYTKQDPAAKGQASGDSLGDLLIPERYASFAQSGIEVSVLAQGNAPFILKLEPDPASADDAAAEEPAAEEPAPAQPAAAPADSTAEGESSP